MKQLTVQITDKRGGAIADAVINKVIEAAEQAIVAFEKANPDADFMSQLGTDVCPDQLEW